jgi:hypothetical protein
VEVYVWPDTTLRELTDLWAAALEPLRVTGTVLDVALVYPDIRSGRPRLRELGSVQIGVRRPLDAASLGVFGWLPGDALDVVVLPPPIPSTDASTSSSAAPGAVAAAAAAPAPV